MDIEIGGHAGVDFLQKRQEFLGPVALVTLADLERLEAKGRLERVADTLDICPVVEFFLSEASDFVSGQVLRIDGGQFTGPI